MNTDNPSQPGASTPEATASEQAQRATELALEVRNEHPDDLGAQQAWEALATARALMYGAYSAAEFLYSAEVAIRRALHLIFDVAWKYHHPDPGRASWDQRYDDYPAIGAWHAAAHSAGAAISAAYPSGFWDDIQGRDSREFRSYCRLAKRVATPEFRTRLEDLVQPWDGSMLSQTLRRDRARAQYDLRYRRHLQWVLAYLDGQPLPTGHTEVWRALAAARAAKRIQEERDRANE